MGYTTEQIAVVNHDGVTSINFDRGGYAALIEEAALLEGDFDGDRDKNYALYR